MDTRAYLTRPFRNADYEAEARIDEENAHGFGLTAGELQHYSDAVASEPGRVRLRLAVEARDSGTVVGYGGLSHSVFDFHPEKLWISVGVDRAHRKQGIGTELYAHLEREARARGAKTLWSGVREGDHEGTRFFGAHGFIERRRVWSSKLDLTQDHLTTVPDRRLELESDGIRFTTLAEEGPERADVQQRLYRLSDFTSRDVPRMGEYAPVSFEVFLQVDVNGPGMVRDGYFLAAAADQYVGMTSLEHDPKRPDTLRVGFTGTHPDYRGRGIASELKRRAVEFARGKGFRSLVTHNDSLNAAMWAINQKLGFRPEITWIDGEKRLLAPGPRPD